MTTQPERLKALSIRQPWIELILRGVKTIEYRTVATHTRGTIYLYASRLRYPIAEEIAKAASMGMTWTQEELDSLPHGLVIGRVDLVDCQYSETDQLYHWHLKRPIRLRTPLPPREKPQPIFFHPFGRPEAATPSRRRAT